MRILLLAGEESGVLYAEGIRAAVLARRPDAEIRFAGTAAGIGVFTVNGKMVDVAFMPGAERTLRLAKACGMYEGDLV